MVFDKLHETPFDLSRAVVKREGVAPYVPPDAAAALSPLKESTPELNTTKRLGTLVAIDKGKSSSNKPTDVPQQMENIAKMWSWTGHQTNFIRLAVADVLSQGYTKTDLTKVIRSHSDEEWDGSVNNGNDKTSKVRLLMCLYNTLNILLIRTKTLTPISTANYGNTRTHSQSCKRREIRQCHSFNE